MKLEESKKEDEDEELKSVIKKEPLSLEELLAKKKAEEAEKSKVGKDKKDCLSSHKYYISN